MVADKRLHILSRAEIQALYGYPVFSESDQQFYFDLKPVELEAITVFKRPNEKIYAILQVGYFKAKNILFSICFKKSAADIAYIQKSLLTDYQGNLHSPSSKLKKKIKSIVSAMLQIPAYQARKRILTDKITQLVKQNAEPRFIFKELLAALAQATIPLLAYSSLQSMIGQAFMKEEKRLTLLLKSLLTKKTQQALNHLLTRQDGLAPLTALKSDPKNFRTQQLQAELQKHQIYRPLFEASKIILPQLDLSKQNSDYYASLAIYYDVYELSRFTKPKAYLYLLCFIHKQFYKINNNLIEGFIHYVRDYDKKADQYARDEIYNIKLMFQQYQTQLVQILNLFNTSKLDHVRFKQVKRKAFKIIPKDKLSKISYLIGQEKLDKRAFLWEFHANNHKSVVVNLRPLFQALDLDCQTPMASLKSAISFMRGAFAENKPLKSYPLKQFPTAMIPAQLKPYLFSKPIGKTNYKLLDPTKYEYWVYQTIERNLSTGIVSADHSIDYKSLESDLQLSKPWETIKEEITQATPVPALQKDVHTLLEELQVILEALIERVNNRIETGENKDIRIKKKGDQIHWSIPYLKINPDYNNPFYDKLGHINITDLMAFVDQQCGFMKAFKHIKPHQTRNDVDYIYLIACLIANATGLGIYKMSESSQLVYDKLRHIHQSRIRLATLMEANQIISDHIQKLPVFKYYAHHNGLIHGSADGQKVDVRLQTFISRYLRKYFKEKGVSVYTLLINNVAVNAKVINGHESHFLFDLICNNKTSIQPHKRVTTLMIFLGHRVP